MVVELKQDVVDGHSLKWLMAAGVSWLEHHKMQINEMNVFPVPDGDTGTNMLMTIRKAYQQVMNSDEEHIGIVAENIAQGALMGARGNSGTILSMLLRGFSKALEGKEVMNASTFAQACQQAVDYAYETVSSVMKPVEGTILTVAREAAATLNKRVMKENDLKVLLSELVDAAHKSLENTPNLLPKLKQAGVVDSGGMGLVMILEGMSRFIDGLPVVLGENEQVHVAETNDWEQSLIPEDEEGYGYDVQFLMIGENLNVQQVRQDISDMGWSPLVDGDANLIKVHIHVHNPADPLDYAIKLGVDLDDIVVENMQAQYLQYVQQRNEREQEESHHAIEGVAVITVARGEGLEVLFTEYGAAYTVIGGQTMNPSTEDFLLAIESIPNDDIIILPNNSNVIMAAQQAAGLTPNKNVQVVPSKSVQQGVAALIAYADANKQGDAHDVLMAMKEALSHIISVDITTAVRDTSFDGVAVKEGHYIGMINNKLVMSGDQLSQMVIDLLGHAEIDGAELVTLYYGDNVTEPEVESMISELEDIYPTMDYDIVYGGQPLYPYLISIE